MASRLAPHCHRAGPDIDRCIRSAPWAAVKALSDPAPLATARDAGIPIRIFRLYGVEALAAPDAAAAFLAHDLSAATHVQLANESPRGSDWQWQAAVIAGLRAGGYRGKVLGLGYPTGNPATVQDGIHPGPHFPDWLQAAPHFGLFDGLALDQYAGLPSDDPRWADWLPWTACRDGLVQACLARHALTLPPVVITESGIDNVVAGVGGGGWLSRGISPDRYVQTLIALDQQDQARPWVLARCIFTLGATPDWAGYEVAGIIDRLAAYVRSQASDPPTPPKGPPVPDYAPAAWAPSPNFWPGRNGASVRAIVLHATAGPGAVSWFQDPNADPKVSAHYVIEEDGRIIQCVAEADSAWHAGVVTANSAYAGGDNPNHWSIGIEHTRDTTNTSPITGPQLAASLALVRDILRRHGPLSFILHDQIDVGRVCPGPGFPLQAFQALLTPPAPPPVPPTPSRAPKGHPGMPAPIFRLPQDPGSLDCWVECVRELFARYGYVLPLDAVFAAGKGKPRPVGGEAATFAEVERAIRTLAQQLGVAVQLLELDSPGAVMAALHDPDTANPWTVLAGVKESDLQGPSQTYGHFLILDSVDAAGNITVTDSYAETDGDPGHYPASQVQQAMVDNFDPLIDALAAKLKAA